MTIITRVSIVLLSVFLSQAIFALNESVILKNCSDAPSNIVMNNQDLNDWKLLPNQKYHKDPAGNLGCACDFTKINDNMGNFSCGASHVKPSPSPSSCIKKGMVTQEQEMLIFKLN